MDSYTYYTYTIPNGLPHPDTVMTTQPQESWPITNGLPHPDTVVMTTQPQESWPITNGLPHPDTLMNTQPQESWPITYSLLYPATFMAIQPQSSMPITNGLPHPATLMAIQPQSSRPITNGLPHPATLTTTQPQLSRPNKRSASPSWHHDHHYNRESKIARHNLSLKTESVLSTTPLLQAINNSSRMQIGYNLDQNIDLARSITPPLQGTDSLSERQPRRVRHNNYNPTHELLEPNKYESKPSPTPSVDQRLASNTTTTDTQPAPQLRSKPASRLVRTMRYPSRGYGDTGFKARREHVEALPRRQSPRHSEDCDTPRLSVEKGDALWSARYEIAASTYKVTHSCLVNLLRKPRISLDEDIVHPGVAIAIRAAEKQVREEWPEEQTEVAYEMREVFRSPLDRVPNVETLLDLIILMAGLADLPGDKMLSDIERECYKAALEAEIKEHKGRLYAEGIEVGDVEDGEDSEDAEQ
ncbi:hypothetical protein Vi05172_g4010 [Venturia inaequalis]|nr:hypothetical protein Vi05172_g4010 [Venturia inaequalis]